MVLHVNYARPEDRPLVLAAEVVQAGGVIVYPTETIYGIGANAWNPEAISRVQKAKKRESRKPILVLIPSQESLTALAAEITASARMLVDTFWPGPLTLVLKAAPGVSTELTAGTGTIGVRLPSSAFCRRLLDLCGCPLASTSANLAGKSVLRSVEDIQRSLGSAIDLYLDAGVLRESLPSTVVDVSGEFPRLIRSGAISADRLQEVVPEIRH